MVVADDKSPFSIQSSFSMGGKQAEVVESLMRGLHKKVKHQTLLGVTGSGKTFTMANLIARTNRPALIMAPNKTLAAQLYGEMKSFFPNSAVEYFVSYYDYYQPEAYVPSTDTFIEKDASINAHIEQMRLSATKAILERKDTIIVATVSAIYGLGDPESYLRMVLHLSVGELATQRTILRRLTELQYRRNDTELDRGRFRVRGDVIDVYPAENEDTAIRIQLFDDEIEKIESFDPLTGVVVKKLPRFTFYPKTHYVTPKSRILATVDIIKEELKQRVAYFEREEKLIEAQRISQRCQYDIEMMLELGYCTGIENYSRYLSGREAGQPPPTLLDYLPDNALLILDESHVTVPQIGGMYAGDRSRKSNLVEFGFRLPSALDNRPLRFAEFEAMGLDTVYVSATPGPYEKQHANNTVELLVRPTGLLDPVVEVRPAQNQVLDIYGEIQERVALGHRVLITTLTKKMSEQLAEFLHEKGVKVRYLHSSIDTVERVEILRDLRLGVIDVLVGINLLREGLDLPEVSLVGILDADKEGFLRSTSSLIQTIGRCARHLEGKAILYADKITGSMQRALEESSRRRQIQDDYNREHGITPQAIKKAIHDVLESVGQDSEKDGVSPEVSDSVLDTVHGMTNEQILQKIAQLDRQMIKASKALEFEQAASLRDEIHALKELVFSSK